MTVRFVPPPGWPPVPAGWVPPAGWQPDPTWPPAPAGWTFWQDATAVAPAQVSPRAAAPVHAAPPPPAAPRLDGPTSIPLPPARVADPGSVTGPPRARARLLVPALVGVGGLLLGLILGSTGGVAPTETDEYRAVAAELEDVRDEAALAADDLAEAREDAEAAEAEAAAAVEQLAALEAEVEADGPTEEPGPTDVVTEVEPEPEETFVMPDLVGMNLQLAQDTLQALGSYVMDQEDASGLDRFQINDSNWKVCSQGPAARSEVAVSTSVMLSSVKLDETCP